MSYERAGQQSAGIKSLDPGLFPFTAWEFDDPMRTSSPTLTLVSPWNLKAGGNLSVVGAFSGSSASFSGLLAAQRLQSTVSTGTSPLIVASSTKVANLNAEQVDGYDAGNSSGNVPVSNGTVNTNLNADSVDAHHITSGVWDPVVSGATTPGTPTYTYQDGSYVKVGAMVSFRLHVKLSSLGGCVGIIRISIPYANVSGADKYGACAIGYLTGTSPSAGYTYHAVTIPGTSYIYFFVFTQSTGTAAGPLGEGSFTNSFEVILSGIYEAT